MARLLAAERRARLEHPLEHVAVADVGHLDRDPVLAHQAVEAQVRHRRDDDPLARERVAPVALDRERRDDGVAVHGPAAPVDREAAIGVAVEREAAVRLGGLDGRGHGAEVRRANPVVDVPAVGVGADEAGVEVHALGEPAGGGRGGPVRAVEHHQAIALHPLAVRLEQPVGVALDGVLDRLDAAAARARGRAHRRLDVGLGGVGQLAPVGAEELDAVVGVRVVRGRDDAAQVGAELSHQDRDAGSRDDPGRERGASAGDDAVDEGGLERRARLAGVSAQHDPAPRAGDGGRRRPQLAGEVLGQIDAGDPPHAVCPEQLAERCQGLGVSASRTAAACGPSSGRPSCARPGGRRGSGTPASSGRCAGSRRPR